MNDENLKSRPKAYPFTVFDFYFLFFSRWAFISSYEIYKFQLKCLEIGIDNFKNEDLAKTYFENKTYLIKNGLIMRKDLEDIVKSPDEIDEPLKNNAYNQV